jgi:hypothetical protein
MAIKDYEKIAVFSSFPRKKNEGISEEVNRWLEENLDRIEIVDTVTMVRRTNTGNDDVVIVIFYREKK